MKVCLALIFGYILSFGNVFADMSEAESLGSIIKALQEEVQRTPPVFPLESYEGGVQPLKEGLRHTYFGYGERRYTNRFDFHPAIDVGYFPVETGVVTTENGKSQKVRAPQTYLKKVYAIQKGELVSIALISTGYKLILKHTLETPYYNTDGKAFYHYYTCYRHLDSRSLAFLDGVAREFTGDADASHEALFGNYTFEAGEQIALVGFAPPGGTVPPRAHLDFSLNLFGDPNKGSNIRKFALNPLLLFPPLEYTDPQSHVIGANRLPAYQFVVDQSSIIVPSKKKDGQLKLQIHCGGLSSDGEYTVCRYFALNAVVVMLVNDGESLGGYRLDRHLKMGYNTESYTTLDNPNTLAPHFLAPLGEQGDVFEITFVLPRAWFKNKKYNWSKSGFIAIGFSSIWQGYLKGHGIALKVPLEPK